MLFSKALFAVETTVTPSSSLGHALMQMANVKGFSTPFKQVLSYAEGGERVYTGTLAVLRPGQFNWRYIKPFEQRYVSNGDGIWLYEPDLLQAQKLQDLGELDPVVMQLLDGRIGLADVEVLAQYAEEGVHVWHVKLGKANKAVEVWLGVDREILSWIESRDVLSNTNRLYLLDIDTSKPKPEQFEFTAPEGVDVVGDF
ncbi:MAG: outer-membrane lipoprotein carrier protein LolA [Ghiorsea sp.]|nr:outer-membrane lipoprotein carrier protein LolA [Ghiorsea sp.]